uniref:Uncharacterized protein n=1 Tax=Globodera rostochiensis TaxID=31243 RepID=A0A914I3A6_GLORO
MVAAKFFFRIDETTTAERREILSKAATSARTPTEDLLIKMTLEAMGHAARMERLITEYLRRGGGSVADSDVHRREQTDH